MARSGPIDVPCCARLHREHCRCDAAVLALLFPANTDSRDAVPNPGIAQVTERNELRSTPSVLVVDDDASATDALRALLEMDGFRVEVANLLGTAVALCDSKLPDVLISDIALPDGDGCELARKLRKDLRFKGVIVAVTGYVDRRTDSRLKSAGFDARFAKPLNFADFRAFLDDATPNASSGESGIA